MNEKQIFKYKQNGREKVITNRYTGQRFVEIRKHNGKSGITHDALDIAISIFGGASSSFGLYCALAKNSHGYKLKIHTSESTAKKLGLKTILSEAGISLSSYYKAFHELIQAGYLVSQPISFDNKTIHDEETYYFYDIPQAIQIKPSCIKNTSNDIPSTDFLESLVQNK